jgi:UDP-N-acetylmuramoyl-L-alanyl-D-glutamate--2,6-diaminopimelate ligase
MELQSLIRFIEPQKIIGPKEGEINQIIFDSRKAKAQSLFVAVKGTQVDGHEYIENAINAGVTTVVAEHLPAQLKEGVTFIQVEDSAAALGQLASGFYGQPSNKLKLVGITGTNGKTTTATLLYRLFLSLGYKTGLLSTIENRIGNRILDATHTTPDAVSINRLLAEMLEAECDYVFMEVSSHAIHQKRIEGLHFTGGIFTNISHDHLNYHKTFKAYIEAKKAFFDYLPKSAFALLNLDDRRGTVMGQNTQAKKYYYSLRKVTDFKAKILENTLLGLHLDIDTRDFYGQLIGAFNAYNLLAVYATAVLLEQDKEEVLAAMSLLRTAEGRFDQVLSKERQIIGIVDYAHTPDALEQVLVTIQKLRQHDANIITVVGCGGDRDKAKRPRMAAIACKYSNQVILTSDNPRTEDPKVILEEMETGVPISDARKVLTIVDRLQAIRTACRLANEGDIILVAGKGHEKYQEINGVKNPFDDKKVLKEELQGKK